MRRTDQQAVERASAESGTPLRENGRDTGRDGCRRARAADRPEANVSVVAASGLRRRDGDARGGEARLQSAVEHEPPRRERCDRASGLTRRHLDVADRHRDWYPCRDHRSHLVDHLAREPDDGNPGGHVEAEGAGREWAVDEHGKRSGGGRLFDGVVRERGAGEKHDSTGDRADAFVGEERGDASRCGSAVDEHDVTRDGARRRAAERHVVLVENAQAGPHVHTNRGRGKPPVGSGDGDRRLRRTRSGDAPVSGPGAAVVPRGNDGQRVELGGARDTARNRSVDERSVRLDHRR